MSASFSIKRTNLLPSVVMVLDDPAVDLTGDPAVTFVYRLRNSTDRRTLAMVIVDAETKTVRVDFDADSVSVLGAYDFHVEVGTAPNIVTVPRRGFSRFDVTPTIEAP
jgi:hypothetical protein